MRGDDFFSDFDLHSCSSGYSHLARAWFFPQFQGLLGSKIPPAVPTISIRLIHQDPQTFPPSLSVHRFADRTFRSPYLSSNLDGQGSPSFVYNRMRGSNYWEVRRPLAHLAATERPIRVLVGSAMIQLPWNLPADFLDHWRFSQRRFCPPQICTPVEGLSSRKRSDENLTIWFPPQLRDSTGRRLFTGKTSPSSSRTQTSLSRNQ